MDSQKPQAGNEEQPPKPVRYMTRPLRPKRFQPTGRSPSTGQSPRDLRGGRLRFGHARLDPSREIAGMRRILSDESVDG
jgi:hypothetical protein